MSNRRPVDKIPADAKPLSVSISMYNVGFGDCFLLTFAYPDEKKRQILIDCGTTSGKKPHMEQVVDRLIADCDGRADAVVVTHRHADHLSAFGLKGVGNKLESLSPTVVVQPWTEHPGAKSSARSAPSDFAMAFSHETVNAAEQFALRMCAKGSLAPFNLSPRDAGVLKKIAALNIKNKAAIGRLENMGTRHAYVHAGGRSGLEPLLPGVEVIVLGPLTLEQTSAIKTQTKWNDEEFWKFSVDAAKARAALMAASAAESPLFPRAEVQPLRSAPSCIKWVVKKANAVQVENIKRIVRDLDGAMNNTSVVLMFRIGKKALLFPGDAQLENWQYALQDKKLTKLLADTIVYKVGHHGSTNATPKSLWGLFRHRGKGQKGLVTLMSTLTEHHSGVPRKSLVAALAKESVLYSTEKLGKELCKPFTIKV